MSFYYCGVGEGTGYLQASFNSNFPLLRDMLSMVVQQVREIHIYPYVHHLGNLACEEFYDLWG